MRLQKLIWQCQMVREVKGQPAIGLWKHLNDPTFIRKFIL
jgi:hypothetical protein